MSKPSATDDADASLEDSSASNAKGRRRPWLVWAAGVFLVLAVLLALLAPVLPLPNPGNTDYAESSLPSAQHWLGTDHVGRDLLSRVIFGARSSLSIGLIAVSLALSIGLPLGLLGGYFGGWIDRAVTSILEILLAFPSLLLALVIVAFLGGSLFNVMIAVGIAQIPHYGRQVRASVLSLREIPYTQAAKALGLGPLRIVFLHILPNAFAPVLVLATMGLGSAILDGAGLAFLGVAGDPTNPEWGQMLADGRNHFDRHPFIVLVPGIAITLTVLSFNLLGDALRDWLDPRLA